MEALIARAIDGRLDLVLAIQSHSSWPRVWSTEAENDLQNRLSQLPFYAPNHSGLGDGFSGTWEDLQSLFARAPALLTQGVQIIEKAGPYLDTILKVVEDPALPQLVSRVKTLQALATGPQAATASTTTPSTTKGVGLQKIMPMLDVAILYFKYPWAPWAIGAGTILLFGGIGFGIGRLTRKSKAALPTAIGYRRRKKRR